MSNQEEKIKKLEEKAEKMKKSGEKMERLGTMMTFAFTFPILGFFIFGFYGLFIGLAIGIIGLAIVK